MRRGPRRALPGDLARRLSEPDRQGEAACARACSEAGTWLGFFDPEQNRHLPSSRIGRLSIPRPPWGFQWLFLALCPGNYMAPVTRASRPPRVEEQVTRPSLPGPPSSPLQKRESAGRCAFRPAGAPGEGLTCVSVPLSPCGGPGVPRALLSLCRVAVRRALGKHRLHLIPSLPLPEPMKSFLLYQ